MRVSDIRVIMTLQPCMNGSNDVRAELEHCSYDDVPISNESETESWMTLVSHDLKLMLPPILITLGTGGNILGFFVVRKSQILREISASVYVRLYFIVSTCVLFLGSGQDWLCRVAGLPLLWNTADFSCRIWEFASSVLYYFPIWTLVALVVDRLLVVSENRYATLFSSVFSAKVISVVIFLGLVTVSVHGLWTYELNSVYGCAIPPDRKDFHSTVWPWISVIIYSFLPLILLLICGTGLLVAIVSDCRHTALQSRTSTKPGCDAISGEYRVKSTANGINGRNLHQYEITMVDNQDIQRQDVVVSSSTIQDLPRQSSQVSAKYKEEYASNQSAPLMTPLTSNDATFEAYGMRTFRASSHCSQKCFAKVSAAKESTRHVFAYTALSMAYMCVLCTLPATVMNVYIMQVPVDPDPGREKLDWWKFHTTLFQMLAVLNHAILAPVAFLSSGITRAETRSFLHRLCSKALHRSADGEVREQDPDNTNVKITAV